MKDLDVLKLVKQLVKDNQKKKAMAVLYKHYGSIVIGHLIKKRHWDEDTAIDLFIFAMNVTIQKIDLVEDGKLQSYLIGCAIKKGANEKRKKIKEIESKTTRLDKVENTLQSATSINGQPYQPYTENKIRQLRKAVKMLPKSDCKKMLTLVIEGYSHKEIAIKMPNINTNKKNAATVSRVLLSRCLKKNKDLLKQLIDEL